MYLEWNLVRLPELRARQSLVSTSSEIMWAMRITMSSTAQVSYASGSTFGAAGRVLGL